MPKAEGFLTQLMFKQQFNIFLAKGVYGSRECYECLGVIMVVLWIHDSFGIFGSFASQLMFR